MNYAYIRVSTNYQTVQNQKIAIREYAKYHRIHNIVWVAETISGTKNPEKRKFGSLLSAANEGDTIIVTELSRLGRSMMMILDVLQLLLEKNVKVIAIKEGYELGDNIQSKVLAFAFGLSAEIERTLLSERTKQAWNVQEKWENKSVDALVKNQRNTSLLVKVRIFVVKELKEEVSYH